MPRLEAGGLRQEDSQLLGKGSGPGHGPSSKYCRAPHFSLPSLWGGERLFKLSEGGMLLGCGRHKPTEEPAPEEPSAPPAPGGAGLPWPSLSLPSSAPPEEGHPKAAAAPSTTPQELPPHGREPRPFTTLPRGAAPPSSRTPLRLRGCPSERLPDRPAPARLLAGGRGVSRRSPRPDSGPRAAAPPAGRRHGAAGGVGGGRGSPGSLGSCAAAAGGRIGVSFTSPSSASGCSSAASSRRDPPAPPAPLRPAPPPSRASQVPARAVTGPAGAGEAGGAHPCASGRRGATRGWGPRGGGSGGGAFPRAPANGGAGGGVFGTRCLLPPPWPLPRLLGVRARAGPGRGYIKGGGEGAAAREGVRPGCPRWPRGGVHLAAAAGAARPGGGPGGGGGPGSGGRSWRGAPPPGPFPGRVCRLSTRLGLAFRIPVFPFGSLLFWQALLYPCFRFLNTKFAFGCVIFFPFSVESLSWSSYGY